MEGADDFKSMNEVVKRRLLRAMEPDEASQKAFGSLPDLMVIDGGRGQLNAALRAMDEVGLHIPTIGLAKQLEEVYVPDRDETVMLDRKSPALHVLQRIRDEAHRFAITYHRSLRASHELTSALDTIPGIGPKRRRQLLMQYNRRPDKTGHLGRTIGGGRHEQSQRRSGVGLGQKGWTRKAGLKYNNMSCFGKQKRNRHEIFRRRHTCNAV